MFGRGEKRCDDFCDDADAGTQRWVWVIIDVGGQF